jgi:hypothetical protein
MKIGGSHKKNKKHSKMSDLDDDDDEFDDEDDLDEDEFDDEDDLDDEDFDDDDDDLEDEEDDLRSVTSRHKGRRQYTQRAVQRKNKKNSDKKQKSTRKMKRSNKYEETSQSGGEEYQIDAKYFYSSEPSNNIYGNDDASDMYGQFRYRSN